MATKKKETVKKAEKTKAAAPAKKAAGAAGKGADLAHGAARISPRGAAKNGIKVGATKPASGTALVIVESPAKQKTISRMLDRNYVVRSSYGHVRDLPERKLGVDEKKNFEPTYVLLPRTKKILPELKELAQKAAAVYLATDHDREGESIAWHLVHILDLPEEKIHRITFHEITQNAILEALRSPRALDLNLVQAQQARRVIDRLVGYKLSPLLWKKVRRGLSAGRVQSAAVRLLVERHKEISEFKSEPYWTLGASLEKAGSPPPFESRLTHWKGEKIEGIQTYQLFSEPYRVRSTCFQSQGDIDAVVSALKGVAFVVSTVERKEARRNPPPPWTTSTLQQAASQQYGFAADRTMRIAQTLYEGVDIGETEPVGLITYMRTDSVSVAKPAQEAARKVVESLYGGNYLPKEPPIYKTKSKGAQEAHEAIRPTNVERHPDQVRKFLEPDQAKLYDLIWKRFVASQMTEAIYDTISSDITAGEAIFRATGRTLKFDGFLRVYEKTQGVDEEADTDKEEEESKNARLPDLNQGDKLSVVELKPEEHKTSPPPYYNEASLIRALEKHGIGRPSTYAPTIKTVVERGYVQKGTKDRTLIPSELGILVTEKLKEHFPDVVSLAYTADVEERLDNVAEGQEVWQKVVSTFYDPFQKSLKTASSVMEDTKPLPSNEICPLCKSPMLIRESRFGKYLSCSTFPACKGKIRLTPTGEKLVPQVTDEKCEVCGKAMVIRVGRKGKFLACSGYPACKNTYSLDADGKKIPGSRPLITGRKCEKCSSAFWLRLGKRGHFLACSGFPKCRNLKPVSHEEAEKLKSESASLNSGPKNT